MRHVSDIGAECFSNWRWFHSSCHGKVKFLETLLLNLMKLMEEICKNIMHVVNDHWLVGANFEVFAKLTKKKKKSKNTDLSPAETINQFSPSKNQIHSLRARLQHSSFC